MRRALARGVVLVVVAGLVGLLASTAGVAAGRRLTTTLSGAEEVPGPGDPDASGSATVRLNQGQRRICFRLAWSDVDGNFFAAHIHEAPAGSAGDVVVTLFEGEFEENDDEVSGCVTGVSRSLIKDIRQNPEDYYVNLHSTDFPGGAIRGQLG